jgi:glycerol kinase
MKQQTKQLTLILDQGSHASRIAIFSADGSILQIASQNITTQHEGTHYEQDATEILDSFHALFQQIKPMYIPYINNCGLCTQRSSIITWHKTSGQPLSPALSWRDLRSEDFIESIDCDDEFIRNTTGLPLSAHYSAGKMNWLLSHNNSVAQALQDEQLCIAPLASFLLFHLLQEQPYVIDHSNAQRTQLFDIEKLEWSAELLKLFEIPHNCLPQLSPVISYYGHLKALNIPISCVCGDQNAALHAYPPLADGVALINIGTGAFILSTSDEKHRPRRLLRSIARSQQIEHQKIINYITEGTVNGAGAALSWKEQTYPDDQLFKLLPKWLSDIKSPPLFINTVAGLGSPWWHSAGKPSFIAYKSAHTAAEEYVAIIESIIFLTFYNLQQLSQPTHTLLLSGGLSKLDGLCQKLADLSTAKIFRYSECESSARGCAWLSRQLLNNNLDWLPLPVEKTFSPTKNDLLLNRYKQFVGELEKRRNNN